MHRKKIVCLGGGSGGTSTLLGSIKHIQAHFTSITSMADDGGSSGRLRKAYHIMPPGNLVSCIASLIPDEKAELVDMLMHRFPGSERNNTALGGHKLGNLLVLAEWQRTGDFYQAIELVKQLVGVTNADILPATDERTHLSATTKDGRKIYTETTLDLGLYSEPHGLAKIHVRPKFPKVNQKVIDSLHAADVIISGPGDLYTNQLPVMVIPQIREAIMESKAKKIFILNVANKPFETKGYTLADFIDAFIGHIGVFPFTTIIANTNFSIPMPEQYHYTYIPLTLRESHKRLPFSLVEADLVNQAFPIHHDPKKLTTLLEKHL